MLYHVTCYMLHILFIVRLSSQPNPAPTTHLLTEVVIISFMGASWEARRRKALGLAGAAAIVVCVVLIAANRRVVGAVSSASAREEAAEAAYYARPPAIERELRAARTELAQLKAENRAAQKAAARAAATAAAAYQAEAEAEAVAEYAVAAAAATTSAAASAPEPLQERLMRAGRFEEYCNRLDARRFEWCTQNVGDEGEQLYRRSARARFATRSPSRRLRDTS